MTVADIDERATATDDRGPNRQTEQKRPAWQ